MGVETGIQWCDATLNLWTGCTKVSDGCKFCYAEHMRDGRFGKGEWGPKGTRREVKSWRTTLAKISNRAKSENRRLKVFCSSMSDIFEGPETCGGEKSENWVTIVRLRSQLFDAIEAHPELDFLVLTKRIENAGDFLERNYGDDLPPNLWLGTSVENQEQAEARIPHLLKVPAAVRFLSCEPLIGPVDLRTVNTTRYGESGEEWTNAFTGVTSFEDAGGGGEYYSETGIDWVICGGESGPNARPMHPDHARNLRDQCQAAGVPFLFKQWGAWGPNPRQAHGVRVAPGELESYTTITSTQREKIGTQTWYAGHDSGPATCLERVNKKAAGRLLDGRTWDEYPEVRP